MYDDKDNHCRGHTLARGEKWMSIKYGTFMQSVGTIFSCHTINLRAADKWSAAPPPNKIISIVRKPARGPPYTLRFQMMGATEEECGDDQLHNWLLPLIADRQRAVAKRMGLPGNVIDPRFQSASTSHDGAGAMLKAVRKWMATAYLNKHGIYACKHEYIYRRVTLIAYCINYAYR